VQTRKACKTYIADITSAFSAKYLEWQRGSRAQKKKGKINRTKAREVCVVLNAPVTQDVNAHHRNPEVYEQKHGVNPGVFAAEQSRCHGHQHICHKMHCIEATHLKSEEEGTKV
jgi:hypothetical protein